MTSLLGHLGLIVVEPDWIREEMSRALASLCEHDPVAALRAGDEPGLRLAVRTDVTQGLRMLVA